jgi:hypothetical protein
VTALLPPAPLRPPDATPWDTTAFVPPLPTNRPAPRQTLRRRRRTAGAALALIVLAAWMISSFWISVQTRSPRQPFLVPTASQRWVKSPEPGARAFFRLQFPAFTTLPQTATLWVEGFQQVTTFVDGTKVALAGSVPNVLVDTAPDVPKVVQTIDIRPYLASGINAVGLEVASLNGQAPAFRSRVEIRTGSQVQDFGLSPASWKSTTDAALTGQVLPASGVFSRTKFNDGNWASGVASAPRPGTATSTIPSGAYTQPATGPALTGSFGARSLIASTIVTFPVGCSEGWLRVAATGAYRVSLDGRDIANGTPAMTLTTIPLSIFDLCPVASPGRHELTISVAGSQRPIAYLDGYLRSGPRSVSFATGPRWFADARGTGNTIGIDNSPETVLGLLFSRIPAAIIVPSGPLFMDHLVLLLKLLLTASIAVAIAVACGVDLVKATTGVLCGVLPAVGVVVLLTEFRHIVYVQPPFPSTPSMLALVLGLGAVGVVIVTGASVRRVHQHVAVPGPATLVQRRDGVPRHRRDGWVRTYWYKVAVVVVATGWAFVQSFHIMFNPLWQDELSSLAAAQGIRAHLVPEWPSGFLYWKSEIFSSLIAVIGGIAHDNPSVLRDFSIVWFGATIALFGLLLAPLVVKGRRVYQLIATIVFATAPFEMGHAQDIRMYQMLQFVVAAVALLLLKAIQEPTTKRIVWLTAGVVVMYFTHEEAFGVLPVIPLALFCFDGLRWIRNWRWWVFGGGAVCLICVQLALAKFTHPPFFGVDPSGGPLTQWSPQPFYYLANFFFADPTYGASITIVSSLAVVGLVVGLFRKDAVRLFLATFWIVPTGVVSLLLLTKDTRYVFLSLPFVFALAACGTVDIIDAVRHVVLRGTERRGTRFWRGIIEILAGLSVVAIMLSLIGGINDYGTWTGSAFHANVSHRWLDYPTAVSYVKAHYEPGDIVIADSSAPNLVGYSLGRSPNFWIAPHRTETLLYVFEKDDKPVDTQYGIPVILNAQTFLSALDGAHRVWLVGATSLIGGLLPTIRTIVQHRFTLQEEGESVSVLLATNG